MISRTTSTHSIPDWLLPQTSTSTNASSDDLSTTKSPSGFPHFIAPDIAVVRKGQPTPSPRLSMLKKKEVLIQEESPSISVRLMKKGPRHDDGLPLPDSLRTTLQSTSVSTQHPPSRPSDFGLPLPRSLKIHGSKVKVVKSPPEIVRTSSPMVQVKHLKAKPKKVVEVEKRSLIMKPAHREIVHVQPAVVQVSKPYIGVSTAAPKSYTTVKEQFYYQKPNSGVVKAVKPKMEIVRKLRKSPDVLPGVEVEFGGSGSSTPMFASAPPSPRIYTFDKPDQVQKIQVPPPPQKIELEIEVKRTPPPSPQKIQIELLKRPKPPRPPPPTIIRREMVSADEPNKTIISSEETESIITVEEVGPNRKTHKIVVENDYPSYEPTPVDPPVVRDVKVEKRVYRPGEDVTLLKYKANFQHSYVTSVHGICLSVAVFCEILAAVCVPCNANFARSTTGRIVLLVCLAFIFFDILIYVIHVCAYPERQHGAWLFWDAIYLSVAIVIHLILVVVTAIFDFTNYRIEGDQTIRSRGTAPACSVFLFLALVMYGIVGAHAFHLLRKSKCNKYHGRTYIGFEENIGPVIVRSISSIST